MVLSWATPPPLSSRESAPSTSSTSGLRPVRSSGMTSPLPSRPLLAPLVGGDSETNFSPSRLVCRILATALSGQLDAVAQLQGDLGVVAVDLDVVDLADRHVVDLDRRLRHQVEHVAELDLDGVRVVPQVGAAGQRQAVDREVAAGQRPGRRRPSAQHRARRAVPAARAVRIVARLIVHLQDAAERPVDGLHLPGRALPARSPPNAAVRAPARWRSACCRAEQVLLDCGAGGAEDAAEELPTGSAVSSSRFSPTLVRVSRVPVAGL